MQSENDLKPSQTQQFKNSDKINFSFDQRKDESANDDFKFLINQSQDVMVHHEAVLSTFGKSIEKTVDILTGYDKDPNVEVTEKCQLALARLEWLESQKSNTDKIANRSFYLAYLTSSEAKQDISTLKEILLDESLSIIKRYRAIVALSNYKNNDAILALCAGLKCKSAPFRNEIVFFLGEISSSLAISAPKEYLENKADTVRNECDKVISNAELEQTKSQLNSIENITASLNLSFKPTQAQLNEDEEYAEKLKLKDVFFQELEKKLYFDKSRQDFAEDIFLHLYDLVTGIKEKFYMNGFRRLLLGRKGVGKTILLKSLQNVSSNIFKNLLTIYCDVNYKVVLPSVLIAEALSLEKHIEMEELEKELKIQNKYIFLVFDEMQSAYSSQLSDYCKQMLNELSYIGGSHYGRIHCVITGSSCKLRQLCFGKLKKEEKFNFPNYNCKDLNSTKFCPRWIFPFLDQKDFIEFVKRLPKNKSIDVNYEEFLVKMYVQTSGNPRLINEFNLTNSCESYTYTLKNIDQENLKILTAVFQITKDLEEKDSIQQDLVLEISSCEKWTILFPEEWLHQKIGDRVPISTIFDLADNGYIRYFNQKKQIGIGSPTIFLELSQEISNRLIKKLSFEDIMALKYPFGYLADTAEKLALKYLARSSEKWLDLRLKDNNISNLDIRTIKEDEIKFISLRLFKEMYGKKDAFGADGIIINLDSDTGIVFHRIQIKLGSKFMSLTDADDVISRFKQNEENFLNIWRTNIECNKDNIIYYLVTTRFMNKETEDKLKSNKIKVLNAEYLSKNIWPDEVKDLGKPYLFKK